MGINSGKKEDEIKNFDVRNKFLKQVIYEDCKIYAGRKINQKFLEEYKKMEGANLLAWTEFGKIWANRNLLDYDYDASLLMNYIYYKLFDRTFKIEPSRRYEYVITKDNKKYRGDTMNSFQTTVNEFMDCFWEKYLENGKGKLRSWIKPLSDFSNYKKDNHLPPYIIKFMEVVYTIGNFIPVLQFPENFGIRRNQFANDYWDLTLLAIYDYYIGEKKCLSLDLILGAKPIKEWLKRVGEEKEGHKEGQEEWNNFVKNNFMQPFVEGDEEKGFGKPRELWDDHFVGSLRPKEEWQFEQFFVNARIRILERGKLMADALIHPNNAKEPQ